MPSASMDLVLRKASTKKRHTKPCKFFQTMQCPFSAEECDFAHVPKEEYSAQPLAHRTKLCRYYMSGHCNQGVWCKFKHQVGELKDQQNDPTASVYRSLDWGGQGQHKQYGASSYPAFPPLPFPLAPAYLTVETSSSPMFSDALRHSSLTSPTYSSDSSTVADVYSPTDSSSSVTNDDVVIYRDDHYMSERAVPLHSPADEIAYMLTHHPHSTNAHLGNLNQHLPDPVLYPIPQVTSHPQSVRSRSRSRPPGSRKKSTHKTKPCKFYKLDGICPNGDQCTFIHDEKLEGKTNSKAALPDSSEGSDSSRKSQYELPSKPLSLHEQNKKKGFFPIAWRVIGGGVMIGGKSRNEGEKRTSVGKLDSDVVQTSAPPSVPLLDTTGELFPSVTELDNATPRPRKRALSSPTSPTSCRTDFSNLFPAESPGIL